MSARGKSQSAAELLVQRHQDAVDACTRPVLPAPTVSQTRSALDRIGELAREYHRLVEYGQLAEAQEVRRTLDDLGAGSYVDGRWTLWPWVLRTMGVQS